MMTAIVMNAHVIAIQMTENKKAPIGGAFPDYENLPYGRSAPDFLAITRATSIPMIQPANGTMKM